MGRSKSASCQRRLKPRRRTSSAIGRRSSARYSGIPNLAATLERIADKGADGFYRGATADAIVALSKTAGGTMTLADLSEFEVEWQEPIKTTYRGWTVYELPPQGQGIAALMMLNIMERYPLGEWGFHDPRSMHVMIEAKKLAYADMLRYVGDPKFSHGPGVADAVTRTRGGARGKARPREGGVRRDAGADRGARGRARRRHDLPHRRSTPRATSCRSSRASIRRSARASCRRKAGFALHNRGALFTLEPGQPNTLAPRKRPLHTIIPAFMEKDGTRIGFGIMGGWTQSQAHAQFVSNIVDYGMTIQQALEAGRFVKNSFADAT